MTASFNVIFEMDEDGFYVASVPSIPGCYSQGKTLEEAKKNIQDVMRLCLKENPEYSQIPQAGFIGIDNITIHA
jgi:predicted RNase H-like HicB family nuclease